VHLINRITEKQALSEMLSELRQGTTATRIVMGGPGMGKTALLEWALDEAMDMRVIRLSGIEHEAALPYGALNQVLSALSDGIDSLPTPQRRALRVVLGIEDGPAPKLLVQLATLTLLTSAAADSPILVIADDVHWLDEESRDSLAFAARRSLADPVGFLFGLRGSSTGTAFEGLPSLWIEPLNEESSFLLLTSRVKGKGVQFSGRLWAQRILAESQGNPLAIVQLGDLLADGSFGNVATFDPLPITQRLEKHFLQRVRLLSDGAQKLLLIAACEPGGDAAVICEAGRSFDLPVEAADECLESSLLTTVLPVFQFEHPLVRSAVHGGASSSERREVHLALAKASEGRDEDMRAWHLGSGTVEPSEDIASLLEASAERARAKGGLTSVASFLSRATDLTPDPEHRGLRLIAASGAAFAAGSGATAGDLIQRALPLVAGSPYESFAQWIGGLGQIGYENNRDGSRTLLAAARPIREIDRDLGNAVLLDALCTGLIAGQIREPAFVETASWVVQQSEILRSTSTVDALLYAFATRIVDGFEPAVPSVRTALDSWDPPSGLAESTPYWIFLGGFLALDLQDLDALDRFTNRTEAYAREKDNVPAIQCALTLRVVLLLWSGRLREADALISELVVLNSLQGRASHWDAFVCTQIQGVRGETHSANAGIAELQQVWLSTGFAGAKWIVDQTLVDLALARGDYQGAFDAAVGVLDSGFGSEVPLYASLVEAGVRTGQLDAARDASEILTRRSEASGALWGHGLAARSRALLSDGPGAEEAHLESIDRLEAAGAPLDEAHSRLLYGEWLRRCNRIQDARGVLRSASEGFNRIGAAGYAERARGELAAAGERVRKARPVQPTTLTPQEAHVADLAVQVATKAEIAERLYLSVHTVDYHLRNIYRKFGVRSRGELARAYRKGHPEPRGEN
jgi:DNA-binding CsgD family transcriptional regulator